MRLPIALLFIVALMPWSKAFALGHSTFWQRNPSSAGDWFDNANWSAGVPDPGVNARIDNGGTARILSKRPTATAAARHVIVGENNGGFLEQDSGVINSSFFSIGGIGGVGRFTQTGGTVLVGGPGVGQPFFMGSTATLPGESFGAIYELTHGNLILDPGGRAALEIGFAGAGLVRQSGGTISAEGVLVGSRDQVRASRYEMSAGSLQASAILIGNIFQSGPGGEFNFSGGDIVLQILQTSEDGVILIGNGEWVQTGGNLTLDVFRTNFRGGPSTGTIDISGGAVHSTTVLIGDPEGFGSVHGLFKVSGPAIIDTAELEVVNFPSSDSSAEFRIDHANATITVSSELRLGDNTRFAAVPGAVIHMTGAAFVNLNDDELQHGGLSNLTMVFEGGTADVDPFEVAGADIGPVINGFDNNFDLGTLQIGGVDIGQVQLVDQFDNQPGQGEALYVDHFAIMSGSLIDLNGLNLYYRSAQIDVGAIVQLNGGQLIQVPEPQTLFLLVLGAATVLLRCDIIFINGDTLSNAGTRVAPTVVRG